MREYQIRYNGLTNGLRPTDRAAVNSEVLVSSVGGFPDVDGFKTVDSISVMAGLSDLGETFPFPQLIKLQSTTLVCGSTKIWEIVGGVITSRLTGLTAGTIWTVADFGRYILMTNGKIVVKRSGDGLAWSVLSDVYNPVGRSVCAHKGQVILTAPGVGV